MIAWTIYITFAGAVLLLFCRASLARWIALATALGGFAIGLDRVFCAFDRLRAFQHDRPRAVGAGAWDELPSRRRWHQSDDDLGDWADRGERCSFFLERGGAA